MPDAIIIAGPNGAGKSTIWPALKSVSREDWTFEPVAIPQENFVNGDVIAKNEGLSDLAAGRRVIETLDRMVGEGRDFAFETTFAGRGGEYRRLFERLRARGYRVYLAYVWLDSAELSLLRVAQRASKGGHYVPLRNILQRYGRSITNFVSLYRAYADFWVVVDNSELMFRVAAWGGRVFGGADQAFSVERELFGRFRASWPEGADAFPLPLASTSDNYPLTGRILEKIRGAILYEVRRRAPDDYVVVSEQGRIKFIRREQVP